MHPQRIVITGVGLTCPLGNDLPTFRKALLEGKSGVVKFPVRNMGEQAAGVCEFEKTKYQNRKEVRLEPVQEVLEFIVHMRLCKTQVYL